MQQLFPDEGNFEISAARQATRLVDDLLDVSRITRGRVELRLEPVDVARLASGVVETNRPLIEARRHKLAVELPTILLFASADPVRLEQVISNLLTNAAKYTDVSGHIHLTVVAEDGCAVIRVRDNGVGISAKLLPRVFDLFTQDSRSLDRSQGGLGIGLTLVKSLVEMHGGTVEALSDGPGRGSEFVVRLPAIEAPNVAVPEAMRDGVPNRRPLRLLVVDDNIDAAQSLAMMLGLEGHNVRTAHDGPAALEAVRVELPQVVLLDIGLPGMSGYQVAERWREQATRGLILLVAVTGYYQEDDRRKSRQAGFQHHLVKPVDPSELHRLLEDAADALPA